MSALYHAPVLLIACHGYKNIIRLLKLMRQAPILIVRSEVSLTILLKKKLSALHCVGVYLHAIQLPIIGINMLVHLIILMILMKQYIKILPIQIQLIVLITLKIYRITLLLYLLTMPLFQLLLLFIIPIEDHKEVIQVQMVVGIL